MNLLITEANDDLKVMRGLVEGEVKAFPQLQYISLRDMAISNVTKVLATAILGKRRQAKMR